tara:strand:- start:10424 stop:10666 length:243 start_codon:yes stop_codon:yes gene_type:complete
MNDLPNIRDILAETEKAFNGQFRNAAPWKDRYGHVTFNEAMRITTVISLIRWAEKTQPDTDKTKLIEVMERLITAVYRSQ